MNEYNELVRMLCEKQDKKGLDDFNGHFWVELDDGTIYDDYSWDDKEDFRRYFGIKKNNTLQYEKCENYMTHRIVMTMLERTLTAGGLSYEEAKRLLGEYWTTEHLCCMFNATANQYRMGGRVVFGCVYMMSDCGKKKRYICGGENFTTYNDFKKEHNYLAK
jgi:hypothetical protein